MPLLSVLEQGPNTRDRGPSASLRESVDLARHVDGLGYHRFWLAEHHDTVSISSSAPEIVVPAIAAVTERIRVGTGGILVPNSSPLHTAEQFRTLEALFPGRIDLGVGRSAGAGSPAAAKALARGFTDFEPWVAELLSYTVDSEATAQPSDAPLPPIHVLGSSADSGAFAARAGLPYAYMLARGGDQAAEVLAAYRADFVPRDPGARPYVTVGVRVWVGETTAHAESLALPLHLANAQHALGEQQALLSPRAAAAHPWTEAERRARVEQVHGHDIVGDVPRVRDLVAELTERLVPDEIIAVTHSSDHAERKASFERLAEATR